MDKPVRPLGAGLHHAGNSGHPRLVLHLCHEQRGHKPDIDVPGRPVNPSQKIGKECILYLLCTSSAGISVSHSSSFSPSSPSDRKSTPLNSSHSSISYSL